MKHVRKSQSATPARQVTTRLKPSKVTTFAALGTAIAASRERLRTQAQRRANTVKREPLLCIREKTKQIQESADCKVGLPSLPLLAADAD
jgi:hypothetical protein